MSRTADLNQYHVEETGHGLYLLEKGQKSIPAPVGIANIVPSVEALLVPSVPHHSIDQGTTTDTLAHWDVTTCAVQMTLRHCIMSPLIEAMRLKSDIVWYRDLILAFISGYRQYAFQSMGANDVTMLPPQDRVLSRLRPRLVVMRRPVRTRHSQRQYSHTSDQQHH